MNHTDFSTTDTVVDLNGVTTLTFDPNDTSTIGWLQTETESEVWYRIEIDLKNGKIIITPIKKEI